MTCAACGQGDHRYGTTDTYHKFDSMGCVNMLLPRVEKAERVLRWIANEDYRGPMPSAVAKALSYFADDLPPLPPAPSGVEVEEA